MKNLPEIIIHNQLYLIDGNKQEFRLKAGPGKVFRFDQLKAEGKFFSARYDAGNKEIVGTELYTNTDQDYKRLVFSTEMLLSNFHSDVTYANLFNKLSYEHHWGVLLIDEAIGHRLNGILPELEIAGDRWIVDLRLDELRAKDRPHETMKFKDLEVAPDGEHYGCFYHTLLHRKVGVDPNLLELPKDIVALEFPNELGLDPIGTARRYGLPDTALLYKSPQKSNHQARLVPLAETGLPEMIKINKAKLKPEKPARRRGKRL